MEHDFPRLRNDFIFFVALFSLLIIAGLYMSSAKGEYMIHITVINDTDEFQNIIVFQQDDESGLMFNKVFPLPWQAFPLPGRAAGVERKGTAEFPFSQQIGVSRDIGSSFALLDRIASFVRGIDDGARLGEAFMRTGFPVDTAMAAQPDKEGRKPAEGRPTYYSGDGDAMEHLSRLLSAAAGKVTIKATVLNGDRFAYSLDEKGGQHIVKTGGRNKDGSITCRNGSDSLIDVDFYKSETRVAVWPSLASGDEARFSLKRKISFTYGDDLKSGDMIRTRIGEDRAVTVDLAGCSTIEARLVYDPASPGKLKKWIITKQ